MTRQRGSRESVQSIQPDSSCGLLLSLLPIIPKLGFVSQFSRCRLGHPTSEPIVRYVRYCRQGPNLGSFRNFRVDGLGGSSGPIIHSNYHNRQDLKLGSFRVFHVAACVPSGPAIGLWVRSAVSCRGVRVEVGPTTGCWVRSAVSKSSAHSRSSSGVWLVLLHASNPKKQNHVSLLSSITRNRLGQFSWIWRTNFQVMAVVAKRRNCPMIAAGEVSFARRMRHTNPILRALVRSP
jgi:hypothetical protein